MTGNCLINTKSDLKRGQTNYIAITAYYRKPNSTGDLEGPALKNAFILPLGRLHQPIIDYPKAGTWHNKQFRICFTLPSDDDDDVISTSSYSYKDIQVQINNTIYSYSNNPTIFSSTNLSGYRKAIVINPSLIASLETASAYKLSVRVQKNYYTQPWSSWSSIVTLNISNIYELSLSREQLILASHYNTVQGYGTRLYNVYPFSGRPSLDVSKAKGDIINSNNFLAIYNTILGIQNLVNNYATFASTRQNVRFNQSITAFSGSNAPTQEYIMAEKDTRGNSTGLKGRNYFNLLIECMNQLN